MLQGREVHSKTFSAFSCLVMRMGNLVALCYILINDMPTTTVVGDTIEDRMVGVGMQDLLADRLVHFLHPLL